MSTLEHNEEACTSPCSITVDEEAERAAEKERAAKAAKSAKAAARKAARDLSGPDVANLEAVKIVEHTDLSRLIQAILAKHYKPYRLDVALDDLSKRTLISSWTLYHWLRGVRGKDITKVNPLFVRGLERVLNASKVSIPYRARQKSA